MVKQLRSVYVHLTEGIAATLLAAMFLTFLLQIFSRYVLAAPFGWTLELCLTLWLWIVFFGNAFIVRRRDHVSFDIAYLAAPARLRRIMALISAVAIAAAMCWSFLPTLDYIDWMKIRKSATLKIPMRTVFSIYLVFMVALTLGCLWRIIHLLRPNADHEL